MGVCRLRLMLGTGRRARGLLALLIVAIAALLAAPAAFADEVLLLTPTPFASVEGRALVAQQVATFTDSTGDDSATDYSASINWGDGAVTSGTVSGTTGTTGPWKVRGTHTYAEEGTYSVTVTATDNASSASGSSQESVQISDAGLFLTTGTPKQISGSGPAAGGAMKSFEAAIGGHDNRKKPGEQKGGFRHITWDNVTFGGSDPGSTSITSHVVSVAATREQQWGVKLSRGVGVAKDGFTSVNPSVGGKFSPFSSHNIFAPFSSNQIQFQFVSPAPQASTATFANTRAFGVMFMNVWKSSTASIEYLSGTTVVFTAYAPLSTVGQQSFVGVVFPTSAITQVVVTMGTAAIFSFDGTTAAAGASDAPPSGNDLVAGDDVVLAEPANPQRTVHTKAGVRVSRVFARFGDTDPGGKVGDYKAVVNWGDGVQSHGTVKSSGNAFAVTASHRFRRRGTLQVVTTVTDFGGATQTSHVTVEVAARKSSAAVSCSPSVVRVLTGTKCTATVTDVGRGTAIAPIGSVLLASLTPGGSFPKGQVCNLKPTRRRRRSSCSVLFRPTQFPPPTGKVAVRYAGDLAHKGSTAKGSLTVLP